MSMSQATDFAGKQISQISDYLEKHLKDWDEQGVPRPIAHTDQDHVFIAWPHSQFGRFSGQKNHIDSNFCELYEYLQNLNGRLFVIVCGLWLKVVGSASIFVCDSKGDQGIDLLGILGNSSLRSLILAVQSKTSNHPITVGTILTEFGKFRGLTSTQRYQEYRRALKLENSIVGNSWNYLIVANQVFDNRARIVATKLGILLKSIHQIAFDLSSCYSQVEVGNEVDRIASVYAGRSMADLSVDFAKCINI